MSEFARALDRESVDLVAAAAAGRLPQVWLRDREVADALQHLDGKRSVLLTGPAGVGKTAVIQGLAHAMHARGNGALRQLSTGQIMSGTKYIGEWQTKITRVADAAIAEGAALYVTDIWNLATMGRTSNDPSALIDVLRPLVESGRLQLVGEATPEALRAILEVPGFGGLFEQVAVAALPPEAIDEVLARAADGAGLPADAEARRALVKTTTRFSPSRPQPGPALGLLRQVRDFHDQRRAAGLPVAVDRRFVEEVYAIYSGLPLFIVSDGETMPAREIRAWFEQRLVGQREAIEAVVETIALFKAGLNDPSRPLGSSLFVGPTGVGKTELARLLAEFLFGSASRMLRFDLSEFKDYHSFEMLVGAPDKPGQPARLVDPVRAQPFQVVLFDELEKGHGNVWDLFLQLLDEGQLTPPGGQPVSFKNTIVIATSNVGARDASRSLGFGAEADPSARAAATRTALEATFRPELLNRFQHIVVFHSLSADQVRTVARAELARILQREGITSRNLVCDVSDAALDHVIERAFDPRYGARALKRELQRQLVLPIAMALMERRVAPGSILAVTVKGGAIRVRVVDTAASRTERREREPVKQPDGRVLGVPEMIAGLAPLRAAIEEVAVAVDEPFLQAEQARLIEMRSDHEFWNHPREAAMAIRDLERYAAWLARIDRLRARADDVEAALSGAEMRRDRVDAAHRYAQLEQSIAVTRRELVTMGSDGVWDALVEIRPLGEGGRAARDLLCDLYARWAEERRATIEVLREPAADDEPVMIAVQGHHAYGFLAAERGLHKVQTENGAAAASVRTAPWTDLRGGARFRVHRALETTGQLGGRLRSRLECEDGLVLQNARTLTDNRDLAGELTLAWSRAPEPPDEIVRRYDRDPTMVRDVLTGFSSGRPDALAPRSFHELLCLRVDAAAQPGG